MIVISARDKSLHAKTEKKQRKKREEYDPSEPAKFRVPNGRCDQCQWRMEIADSIVAIWTRGCRWGCGRRCCCGRSQIDRVCVIIIEVVGGHFQQVVHVAYQIAEFNEIVYRTRDKCRTDDRRVANAKKLLEFEC